MLSFIVSHAVPADPVTANLGDQAAANPEIVAAFKHRWGLDRPLPEQYGIYLWRVIHGDFGVSISTRQPVAVDLRQHLPPTIELALAAIILGLLVGIPLGILSAVRRDSLLDQVGRVFSLVGTSVPVFWLGLVTILVFYARLEWAPPPGRLSARITAISGRLDVAADALKHLILPALVLSSYSLGIIARMMRGSMLEVLDDDYVRTARAKGLPRAAVLLRHAARNALIPVLTVVGLSFGGLLSGAVVTETVFAWPGLGSYAFQSSTSLDFPAIMGVGIVVATVYTVVNLLVDVAYAMLDPRVRIG